MLRDRAFIVLVPLLVALLFLCIAYAWHVEDELERFRVVAGRSVQVGDLASEVERLKRRLKNLEARVERPTEEGKAVPSQAAAEAATVVPATEAPPTLVERPRGWEEEAKALWEAVARLEGRMLEGGDFAFAGEPVDQLLPQLLDEVKVAGRSNASAKGWSVEQLLGAPDTADCGDAGTAWASLQQDEPVEWIEVDFAELRRPLAIIVRETFNPGAVVRIEAADVRGRWRVVWEGDDPAPACPRNLVVGLGRGAFPTASVRVVLESSKVAGWNEIDAIGMLAENGVQWAVAARASSSYASQGSL
jgi:hypothetical protein